VLSAGGKLGDPVVFDTVIVSDIHQAEYSEFTDVGQCIPVVRLHNLRLCILWSRMNVSYVPSVLGKPGDTVVFDIVIVAEIYQTEYVELTDVGGAFQL
jgi:signal peptidase I